jgi:hypothetical protein
MQNTMKNTTRRPKNLSKTERRLFDQTVAEMVARGIDPAARIPLLTDYVKLAARIERLSEREGDAELGNVATSRAVNVATAERRRLHAAIFAGGHVEPAPSQAEQLEEARRTEADTAWLQFFSPCIRRDMDAQTRERLEGDSRAWESDLERKYGEPSWAVLATPHFATYDESVTTIARCAR